MQVMQNYQGQVKWIYKHFPLDSIHPQARPAAEASECAAEQNKFWEFTDGLFENQLRLGQALYKDLASQFGLDMNQFEDCLDSRKYRNKVTDDASLGSRNGVTGTPGNFINGKLYPGALPFEQMQAIIDSL